MSNRKKGVNLINSRTPAETKEHRREVLEAVHEAKVKGFSHPETVEALRQRFQVTRDMAREYITWYNQDRRAKRSTNLEDKHMTTWDRWEFMYGKAIKLAETTGDYKDAISINEKMDKHLEREEKRLTQYNPDVSLQQTRIPLSDRSPEERALLMQLLELRRDKANTSATVIELLPHASLAAEATE